MGSPVPYRIMLAGSKLIPAFGRSTSFRKPLQDVRRFLAGFESERLCVAGGVIGDAAHHFADRDVIGMSCIFRNKPM